ncbi:unnamed protein product [Acanthosepion pharaonis]|uniref:TOG domain-containing protein n=1 Tax=Acanthosepion pharaonis TaxID=158019 RepID=A0A812B8A5_ACAPH|nr:unnamed protein product [Sepia pharaonis]
MYDTKKVNQWTEYSSTGISQSQTTDVCVFGKGYLEETPVDGKPAITKIKHQKRNSKDISAGTPLGTASLYGHGSVEARSGDITPGQDMIGVIGKGLNPADTNSNNQNSSSPTECFNIKSDIVGMSDGVHGLGISNCFKDKQSLSENNLDASTIDDDFMQISKTMRERMSVRRRKGDKPKQTEISNKFPLEVLLAATNFPATEKPGKPPMGPRIKPKLLNSDNSQLTGNSSSDLNNNPESLTSIPAGGLEEIQRKLIQDDWKLKCEALNLIRQLAKFHPNIFDSGFHPLILAVTKEELDQTIGCLLALMAVSKEFIRNDVEKAFDVMIDNVTCSKALPILISKGLKIHGKEILYLLLENPNLDQLLEKYLPSESAATLRAQMDHLHKKSLMDMSYDSSAPHSAKSLPSSRGGSAGSLLNAQISPKRPVSLKNIESVQEEIKKMGNLLSANDWRTRQKGLEAFKEMCEISPGIVTANITQVFDKFLPRLQDANSKVNLLALKILYEVIPVLHGSMGPVVNLTVNCVATNLSSKNTEIHSTAVKIIDSLVHYLEPSVLLRPFANQVTTNARRCPEIIPKITELVEHEYKIKPKQIEMHILPLLLHLLNCVNGSGTVQGGSCSLRQATTNLISALSQQMGPSLMEKFSQLVDVTPRHQQYLQDIMNHT